jgi:plasmid stability protein
MRTLHLRNVPDEVVARLERLATRQGMSVNAVAVRELTEASRRADNPRLLGELPDHGIDPTGIVEALDVERDAR